MESTTNPNSLTPENFNNLLLNVLSGNNQLVNQSTIILKKFFETPDCIGYIMNNAFENKDERIRLLSYICLRKYLPKHWVALQSDFQEEIKGQLMMGYINEEVLKVKENLSYAIAALAVILAPNNEWPQIFEFIFIKSKTTNIECKKLGGLLLCSLSEALGSIIEPYLDNIIVILNGFTMFIVQTQKIL